MTDVFISYAHEDHDYVRRMAPALEAEGFTVWWDHTIPPGKTWDEVIAKGIADARCCIVLWSKNSVISDWVKEEATIAKDHRKFIPVQIDNSEPPVGFRRIQAAHMQSWSGNTNDPQWQMLVREIRSVVSASRAGGAAGATAPQATQGYSPRSYQPPPSQSAAPSSATRARLIGLVAGVAALLALGVVGFAVMNGQPEQQQASVEAPQYQAEDPAAAPATGQSAELERLRRERDDALRRAEEERVARTRDQTAAAEAARRAEAARQAEAVRQRQQQAQTAAPSIVGRWTGTYNWTTGAGGPLSLDIRSNGTLQAGDFTPWSWVQDGARVTFTEQSGNRWMGTVRGDVISGTMRRYDGSATGTFEFRRGGGGGGTVSAIGTWSVTVNWDDGPDTYTQEFRSNGRWYENGAEAGAWRQNGTRLEWIWGDWNSGRTSFSATLSGNRGTGQTGRGSRLEMVRR